LFTYRVDVVDLVERYFYRPLITALLGASRAARRLQSGRLDAYMTYMLIAVLAVLAVVIATS
jgi:hydrogenase-4 component B